MAVRWRQARVGVAPSSSYIEFSATDRLTVGRTAAAAIRRWAGLSVNTYNVGGVIVGTTA